MADITTELLGLQNILIENVINVDAASLTFYKEQKKYNIHSVVPDNNQTNIIEITNEKTRQTILSKPFTILECEIKHKECDCPYCNRKTTKIHDYRTQIIKDIPYVGNPIFISLRKPRFHCNTCNKNFYPKLDIVGRYQRCSKRLNYKIIEKLSEKESLVSIGKELNVSANKVQRCLNLVSCSVEKRLPDVLGIDEFKGNIFSNQKYQVILTNLETGEIFDIIESRQKIWLEDYFSKFKYRDNVKLFVMDMTSGYNALKYLFPNADVIVDNFHVCKYVCKGMDEVRKRFQRKMKEENRKTYKASRYLFFKRNKELTDNQRSRLNVLLSYHDDLRRAYEMKEQFYDYLEAPTVEIAKKELANWKSEVESLDMPEFDEAISAIHNWFNEIINYKRYGYTNAMTEGKNNKIKVIKRVGFGYTNFANFRKRILLIDRADSKIAYNITTGKVRTLVSIV